MAGRRGNLPAAVLQLRGSTARRQHLLDDAARPGCQPAAQLPVGNPDVPHPAVGRCLPLRFWRGARLSRRDRALRHDRTAGSGRRRTNCRRHLSGFVRRRLQRRWFGCANRPSRPHGQLRGVDRQPGWHHAGRLLPQQRPARSRPGRRRRHATGHLVCRGRVHRLGDAHPHRRPDSLRREQPALVRRRGVRPAPSR